MLGHNRKMSGAECLADMLKGYGVTHVFHVPAVLRKTFAVMETRTDIKRLHVHGEKAAAYMADGYARATGKPGICAAQVIGALNLAAGLRDAWLAHSPVIAMTGGRDPKTKFRKVYQEIDDVPAFEPVTKFNATVDDVTRFPDMVRQNKVRPETPSAFFNDQMSSRLVPVGTVPHNAPYMVNGEVVKVDGKPVYSYEDSPVVTGHIPGTTNFIALNPLPITRQLLDRGQQRF